MERGGRRVEEMREGGEGGDGGGKEVYGIEGIGGGFMVD